MKNEEAPIEFSDFNKRDTIKVEVLNIDYIRDRVEHKSFFVLEPNEFFVNGLVIEMQSANLIVKIYDALNTENKEKFNGVLQDNVKLALFLDKMWSLVK